tara:strand:+ start:81 stop:284 length:204 start_codon:yes stop_codon:yes gene_type:complete
MVQAIHFYWFPSTRVSTEKINKVDFVVDFINLYWYNVFRKFGNEPTTIKLSNSIGKINNVRTTTKNG